MTNLDPYLAVYFITFVVLILLEVPIAYAMLASAFEFIVFNHQSFVMFAQKTANSLADFNMLALPAFLFVGCFMNEVGLTDRLFGMFEKWIGHLPGGLAHANVLSSMVFAGMSGSALADAGGLGTIEVSAMSKAGYDPDFSVAVTYDEVIAKKYSLSAGQYFDVKIEYVELSQEEFAKRMRAYQTKLQEYFNEGAKLQKEIMEQLKKVKYE